MGVENIIHDYSTFQLYYLLLVSDSRVLSLYLTLKFISSLSLSLSFPLCLSLPIYSTT